MDWEHPDDIKRRRDSLARARQTIRRVDAKISRWRAERVIKQVTERQRREANRQIFKTREDLRPNHLTNAERRKVQFALRRWHESKARAYAVLGRQPTQNDSIYRAAIAELSKNTDGFDFVLSDGSPYRFDDVIEPQGWVLTNFKKNPVALFNHNPNFIIGAWSDLRLGDDALCGRLSLAPKGVSQRVDEIRALVEAGILRAVSVGFRPIEEALRPGSKSGGEIYTKCELVEVSLVSIPANPNALSLARRTAWRVL